MPLPRLSGALFAFPPRSASVCPPRGISGAHLVKRGVTAAVNGDLSSDGNGGLARGPLLDEPAWRRGGLR